MPKIAVKTDTKLYTKPDDLRDDLKSWKTNITENWYKIVTHLPQVYDETLWEQWGFTSFEDYCEKEIDVSYRISMHYLKIGRAILTFDIPIEMIEGLGWTKFKEVSHLLKEGASIEEISNIVENAKSKSYEEVKEMVKKERILRSGGEAVKTAKIILTLIGDQIETFERAVNEAKTIASTESVSAAIDFIMTEWLWNHDEGVKEEILKYTKRNEEVAETTQKPVKHSKHAQAGKSKRKKKGDDSGKGEN